MGCRVARRSAGCPLLTVNNSALGRGKSPAMTDPGIVADAVRGHWADRFIPPALRPYARMARLERPIGWWLLLWPCWWSSALAADAAGAWPNLWHLVLFLVGAVAMRGAGCTYNDIVDRDLDAEVARTRSRPIPSGRVSVRNAAVFLVLLALVGLLVLLQFNRFAVLVGVASLAIVAIYPFMKRITDWPQLALGLAFSWGALMGWAAWYGRLDWPPAAPLCRRDPVDHRLRHDLRPSGQGGRRAHRRPLHRAPVRRKHQAVARRSLRRRDGALRRRLRRRGRRLAGVSRARGGRSPTWRGRSSRSISTMATIAWRASGQIATTARWSSPAFWPTSPSRRSSSAVLALEGA